MMFLGKKGIKFHAWYLSLQAIGLDFLENFVNFLPKNIGVNGMVLMLIQ
jgi:hypothetical protein